MTITTFSVEKQATIDPVELTAADAQAAFARGDLTCEALTQAYLDRIGLYNPRYVALITINDNALRDAREIDRRRPTGEPLGPLAGVPVIVKDTMDMAGFPSTGGWRLLSERAGGIDLIPATDSPVVARMRAAGALSILKDLPELEAVLADPLASPDLSDFLAAKEAYLEIFNEIMAREKLDGLVFPQMRDELPPLFGPETVHETSVSEINIAGLPGVTVPAGYYASGAPFGLLFIGPRWSDASLLSFAFDYESVTKHRMSPAQLRRH